LSRDDSGSFLLTSQGLTTPSLTSTPFRSPLARLSAFDSLAPGLPRSGASSGANAAGSSVLVARCRSGESPSSGSSGRASRAPAQYAGLPSTGSGGCCILAGSGGQRYAAQGLAPPATCVLRQLRQRQRERTTDDGPALRLLMCLSFKG
jgi:hypothetical protein